MKWLRNWAIHTAAIPVTLTFIACGAAPDSTGPSASPTESPRPASVPTNVVARSALAQAGWAGFAVWGPAIQVFDQYAKQMPGVSVTFKITRGGGSIGQADTVTDHYGNASTSWILGEQDGPNTVLVTVGGVDTLSFEADAKVPTIVARYNLTKIGGVPLPIGATTGGQYLLAADNTFAFGSEINGVLKVQPMGSVAWVDPMTVQFFLAPYLYPDSQFYKNLGGLFATGKIEGGVMTVTYTDFVDFEIETYVLSGK